MKSLVRSLARGVELRKLLRFENYVIFLPILMATSALGAAGVSNINLLFIWLFANLVSFAALFLFFVVTTQLLERIRRVVIVRLPGIMLLGLVIGTIKSLFTFSTVLLLVDDFGLVWVVQRTLQNIPLGLTTVGLVALVVVARDNYLAQRELLISHRVSTLSEQPGSASARLRDSLVAQAIAEVSKVRARLYSVADIASLRDQANEIRSLAEYTLRPLSHRIWSEQALKLNDLSLRQLARLGLREKPFLPILFVLCFFPGLLNWSGEIYGLATGLGMGLQLSAVILFLQYSTNWFQTRSSTLGVLRIISVALLSALCGSWIYYPGLTFSQEPEMLAMFFTLLTWFLMTSLIIAILSAGLRARADLKSELEEVYGKEQLQRIIDGSVSRFESRRIAQSLHSDVQNRLLSTALQVEQGQLKTKEQLAAELSSVEAMLHEIGSGEGKSETSARQALEDACSAWRGFLEIDLETSGDIEHWDHRSRDLGQLLNEAFSNSKRHGSATRALVKVAASKRSLDLTVSDNGSSAHVGKPGLGFALFKSLGGESFTFSETPEGSMLSLRLEA